MNTLIETLNRFGENALHFAWPMLWQSSVLIMVLFIADFALRRRVRAAVRYALWLVLLVKLLLPPALALPTGVAWWLLPATASAKPHTTKFVVNYDAKAVPSLPPQPIPALTQPPQPPLSAAAWIILAWSTISAGLLVWLTVRWQQVTRDVQRATPVPVWLGELFNETKHSVGLRRTVHLRLTDQAMSPAVCGLFQPVILLPQSLVQRLPPAQLRAVLLHELTHLRRSDVWMNCAQALVQIAYWWHPLLWLANARIRRVREEAVDDAVMLALCDDAGTYAPTLLEVAKLAFHRPLASLGLVGILESRSALRQRIERLMDFRTPRKAGLTIASVLGILAFTALAIPMGAAPPHSSNPSDAAGSPATADNPPPPAGTDSEMAGPATMTFKIDRPPDANHLKKLLLDAGVKMPPTVYVYSDNGVLLVRGDPEQLALAYSTVLKLNGYSPKEKTGEKPVNRGLLAKTNSVGTGDGRKVIFSMLNRIRFDQVSWPDGLPLSEVLRSLSEQTRLRDPDKKGINFTFQTNAPAASAATASADGATTINPTTGLPEAAPAGVAVDPSSINVKLTLTDMRLGDLLDAIVLVADHPIKYSILDDGIVFSTKRSNSASLETRTFKVDAKIFLAALQKQTGLQTNVSAAMRQLLSNVGVDLSPPKTIFYNDRMGVLFVRATGQDLDTVEKVVQVLNYTPPPQIHIKARFIEVPEPTAQYFGTYLIPTGATNVAGILTDPNFRVVIHTIEQRAGTEELAEPEVTTISGRQTQMRATDILTIITNFVFQETSTNSTITPNQGQVEVGPVLDVIPVVLSDGYTIDLRTIASQTEFLGYDKPPTNSTPVVTSTGAIVDVPNILPRFSVRQAVAHVKLWDNQTVVLGGLISAQTITINEDTVPVSGSQSAGEPLSRKQTTIRTSPKKQLLVLITATMVDAAGNRIHSDDEMPFAGNSIPPQDSP
jgi:beta-lactamase regulating signal transducer with metallopeptidase domain